MAHQHAVLEAVERQMLRRRQMAHRHKIAVGVDNLRLPVNNVGLCALLYGIGNLLQRRRRMESVAGIEENKIFTFGAADALVHSVVKPPVGLRYHANPLYSAPLRNLDSAVGRRSVDHKMLKVGKRLTLYTLERRRQHLLGVERDGYDGKQWIHCF